VQLFFHLQSAGYEVSTDTEHGNGLHYNS